MCKLFLEWSEPWWAPNEGGIQLAWPSDPNHVHFRGFRNKSDYPRIWYRSLCNFCEVENHPNVLATWLAGEAAKVVDQLDDEEVSFIMNTYLVYRNLNMYEYCSVLQYIWFACDLFLTFCLHNDVVSCVEAFLRKSQHMCDWPKVIQYITMLSFVRDSNQ